MHAQGGLSLPAGWAGWLALGLGILTVGVGARFALGSELAYLAVSWMPDDAFYYLTPARRFPALGTFSFDGIHPTYGFHPLWMILLSVLATLTSSAEALLRGGILLGALAHALSGLLLFEWLGRGRRGLIGASIFLLNPGVFHLMATGMESALVAPAILALLCLRARPLPGAPGALLLGALAGLLTLARVELFFLALLLLPYGRKGALVPALGGLAAVLLPWGVFAGMELGALLPTSGGRRLIGGPAGLVAAISDILPALEAPLAGLLSPLEAALLEARALTAPTWAGLVNVGLGGAFEVAWGYWLPFAQGGGVRALVLVPGALVLGGGALHVAVDRVQGEEDGGIIAAAAPGPNLPAGLALLGLFAGARLLLIQGLLPAYAAYAYWYRVPEVIALTALLAWGAEGILRQIHGGMWARRALGAYGAALLMGSAFVYQAILTPRSGAGETGYGSRALMALEWMEANLPAGTRVGVWNAGVMGYFSQSLTIVNLDGLANSAEYLRDVIPGEVLRRAQITPESPTLDYLRAEGIAIVADAEHPERLGVKPFQEVIPVEDYQILHRVPGLCLWGDALPTHQVAVVEIGAGEP